MMKLVLLAISAMIPGVAQAQSIDSFGATSCAWSWCPSPTQASNYTAPGNGGGMFGIGQGVALDTSAASLIAYINSINAMKSPSLTQNALNAYYQNLTLNGPGATPFPNAQSLPTLPILNTQGTGLKVVAPIPAAAVPEPASWAMMILGLGLMGLALRRRGVARPVPAAAFHRR